MSKYVAVILLASVLLSSSAMATLDWVYYTSAWGTKNIASTDYQALAEDSGYGPPGTDLRVYASSATDLTDRWRSGNDGSTWSKYDAFGTVYTDMASRLTASDQFYGLKADGKIDLVYFNGSSYSVYANYTGTTAYKAITADSAANWIYAVRADGTGVDRLTISGSSIVFNYFIGAYNFKEIESTGGTNEFYGANADGTLDRVYFKNNSYFTKEDVISDNYKALAADASTSVLMVYGARADGTGVDRIRYNGSAWYKDQSLLTTANYDELATVTGRTNQFYGSTIPEPATVALLGIGGLLFSRKRK